MAVVTNIRAVVLNNANNRLEYCNYDNELLGNTIYEELRYPLSNTFISITGVPTAICPKCNVKFYPAWVGGCTSLMLRRFPTYKKMPVQIPAAVMVMLKLKRKIQTQLGEIPDY